MVNIGKHKQEILEIGFTVIENVFSDKEVEAIIKIINQIDTSKLICSKSNDLFAIRQFLKEVPQTLPLILSAHLNSIIKQLFGQGYFIVKSIYFDKPEKSNWFVSYHQDLTISVHKKFEVDGFGAWSVKQNQFAVQPPLKILKNNFTIRIHLDETDENNGALRVVPKSHLKGIYRPEYIDWSLETETICTVSKGGILIMKPLLLHASSRTISNRKRRVIHIELSNQALPEPLQWSELVQEKFADDMVL